MNACGTLDATDNQTSQIIFFEICFELLNPDVLVLDLHVINGLFTVVKALSLATVASRSAFAFSMSAANLPMVAPNSLMEDSNVRILVSALEIAASEMVTSRRQ